MAFSVSFIVYLGYTLPYKSRKENKINLFNEGITTLVAYLIMVITGLCYRVE